MEDGELGRVVFRIHPRARSIVFRTKREALYVSLPRGTTLAEAKRAMEKLRPKLLAARQRVARPPIDLRYTIDAELFKLSLTTGERDCFLARHESDRLQIVCPPDTDFDDEGLQEWLRKVIERYLRQSARQQILPRLKRLSEQYGLPYGNARISASRGRWGSCSARGDISLSCYLLLLPVRLIDYVLLHELCHTREMNHGERFYKLLDRLTDGSAARLREEMKRYRPEL